MIEGITIQSIKASGDRFYLTPHINQKYRLSSKYNNPLKILLVEDSIEFQRIHTNYLLELGYAVDLACNGKEALHMFKNGYDLILLDIGLPEINGLEVAKEIRKYEYESGCKPNIIIALTGFSIVIQEECKKAQFDDYYARPIAQQELEKVLRYWLSENIKN